MLKNMLSRFFEKIKNGTFKFHPNRIKRIIDSYKNKERILKIPCLEDQAVELAWLNIATPYLERRNYYYNCGSIPGAGPVRCAKALSKWLKDPNYKYGSISDIRKFYDSIPHSIIRKGLYRIFKDKKFIEFGMWIVRSMSDTNRGIAIGHPSSHWFANVALIELDHQMKQKFPEVQYVRYMDDTAMVATNMDILQEAVHFFKQAIEDMGMRLKKWQCFELANRGLTFLSYRFFNGYTKLTKALKFRIIRKVRRASQHMNVHHARGVLSYLGILKWCDSHRFKLMYVYPYVNIKHLRRMVGDADRRKILRQA